MIGGGFKEDKCKFFTGEYPDDYVLREGDLIVTMTDLSKAGDTLGYSALIPKSNRVYLHNQRIGLVQVTKGGVDKQYIYWFMRTPEYQRQIVSTSSGSTVHHTSPGRICEIPIILPSYEYQKKISSLLDSIEKRINNNNAINKNLEQQAMLLFKTHFIDFSDYSGTRVHSDEVGLIPEGWRVYHLSEFVPVVTGKKNANVSSAEGKYPFFSCSQDYSWTNEYSFEGDAILVAGNGEFNVKFYNGKFEAYQRTYVLIPCDPRLTAWLYYAVKYNLNIITSAARGSVIKFITKGMLEDYSFAAPKNLEHESLIDLFRSYNAAIAKNNAENLQLSTLRDYLLPKLMSGEINVSEIDI